jgi:hypothetical protein
MKRVRLFAAAISAVLIPVVVSSSVFAAVPPLKNPNDQGIGMQGRISQPPPTTAPTISLPVTNTRYTELPVTVTGLCTDDLLVRLYKNDAFTGSAICENGSYSIQTDLFRGQNEFVARQYDDLDQASPDSNKITLFFDVPETGIPGSPDQVADRVTLTSNYGRLGADPNVDLIWPINLSGGTGPYAISIDWGDGGNPQLVSQGTVGTFNIIHKYSKSGVYKVVIKATDKNGESSFLQVVAIANGKVATTASTTAGGATVTKIKVLWIPAAICLPLLFTTFWLGKRYQLKKIRYRMKHRILPIDR